MSGIRTAETQENSQNAEVVPEKGASPAPEQKNGTRTEEWHQNRRMAPEQQKRNKARAAIRCASLVRIYIMPD